MEARAVLKQDTPPRMSCVWSFESLSPTARIVLGLLYAVSGVLATSGNLLIFYLCLANRRLRTRSNGFLLSLAMADLLVGILIQPIHLLQTVSVDFARNCAASLTRRYLAAIVAGASIAAIAAISYDRLVHLSQTVNYNDVMRTRKIVAIVSFCWLAPAALSVLTRSIFADEGISFVSVSIYGLSALVAVIVCYVKIIRLIKLKREELRRHLNTTLASIQQRKRKQRTLTRNEKAVKTITIILASFCVFVAPIAIFTGFSAIKALTHSFEAIDQSREKRRITTAYSAVIMVALANSAVNPVIYCFKIPEFRQAAKRLLRRITSKVGTVEN